MGVTTSSTVAATYEPIGTKTLTSAATGITFSTISSAYTDLFIVCNLIQKVSGCYVAMQFNSNNSSYSSTFLNGNGSSASSNRYANDTQIPMNAVVGDPNGTPFTVNINVHNYANTNVYKTALIRFGAASVQTFAGVGLWRNTAAISSIYIYSAGSGSAQFDIGSTITLYGIKAA